MAIRIDPQLADLRSPRAVIGREAPHDVSTRRRELRVPLCGEHSASVGWLRDAAFACQPGGTLHSGLACLDCRRFSRAHWTPNHSTVVVHCTWSGRTPVRDVMHLPGALPRVTPTTSVAEALRAMHDHDISIGLVVDGDSVVGMISTELAAHAYGVGEVVAAHTHAPIMAIIPETTLDEAALQLRSLDQPGLMVVSDDELLGFVAANDWWVG